MICVTCAYNSAVIGSQCAECYLDEAEPGWRHPTADLAPRLNGTNEAAADGPGAHAPEYRVGNAGRNVTAGDDPRFDSAWWKS